MVVWGGVGGVGEFVGVVGWVVLVEFGGWLLSWFGILVVVFFV